MIIIVYFYNYNPNKPDIVVMDKKERKCLIIDIACPFDTRISEKENWEKFEI